MTNDQPHLDIALLESPRLERVPGTLDAAPPSTRGRYETFRFVLRLSPAIHARIAALPPGIVNAASLEFEDIEAFSTFLHETIHWWQHVGSTYGLIMSLTYPAEAHANYNHLKALSALTGPKKSIRGLSERLSGEATPDTPLGLARSFRSRSSKAWDTLSV